MLEIYNVSKKYQLLTSPGAQFRTRILGRRLAPGEEFWALKHVTLSVQRGEILGLIGPNGAGKSTLLQIVAGVVEPTSGRVHANGRIAALLELGAGFNPEFTGRENVYFSSELLGRTRRETDATFGDIEEFADIGEFIDRPVKEYSSGMYVRLAFSTAIHGRPDILLVDEALAVGDAAFANKCIRRLDQLKAAGVTILFVSHDLGLVTRMCHRAALMHSGAVVAVGNPSDVVNRYIAWVHEGDIEAVQRYGENHRHGDGSTTITSVDLCDGEGRSIRTVRSGERIAVRVSVLANVAAEDLVVGILIRNRLGVEVYGTNTRIERVTLEAMCAGEKCMVAFEFDANLSGQEFTVTAATQHSDGRSQDWVDDVLVFSVASAKQGSGVADLRAAITYRKVSSNT